MTALYLKSNFTVAAEDASISIPSEMRVYIPYAERVKGYCLRPLNYLFEGQTYTYCGEGISRIEDSYPTETRSRTKALKMVILLVPGLIVGTIAAVVALAQYYFKGELPLLRKDLMDASEKFSNFKLDQKNPIVIPTYVLPADFSPKKSHEELSAKWIAFMSKLTSPESWEDPAIRTEFDQIFREAHREVVLLCQYVAAQDAANEAQNPAFDVAEEDGEEVGEEKEEVRGHQEGARIYDEDLSLYAQAFSYNSIGAMYYVARNALIFKKEEVGFSLLPNPQSEKAVTPFFTPRTIEREWRLLYNHACMLIHDPELDLNRKLAAHINGNLFFCAIPDLSPSIPLSENWEAELPIVYSLESDSDED